MTGPTIPDFPALAQRCSDARTKLARLQNRAGVASDHPYMVKALGSIENAEAVAERGADSSNTVRHYMGDLDELIQECTHVLGTLAALPHQLGVAKSYLTSYVTTLRNFADHGWDTREELRNAETLLTNCRKVAALLDGGDKIVACQLFKASGLDHVKTRDFDEAAEMLSRLENDRQDWSSHLEAYEQDYGHAQALLAQLINRYGPVAAVGNLQTRLANLLTPDSFGQGYRAAADYLGTRTYDSVSEAGHLVETRDEESRQLAQLTRELETFEASLHDRVLIVEAAVTTVFTKITAFFERIYNQELAGNQLPTIEALLHLQREVIGLKKRAVPYALAGPDTHKAEFNLLYRGYRAIRAEAEKTSRLASSSRANHLLYFLLGAGTVLVIAILAQSLK